MGDPEQSLHLALAAVARAIGQSLEIPVVWDLVADACRSIVDFDAMGIVRVEDDVHVRAFAAAGDAEFKSRAGHLYLRSDYSPAYWPDEDEFVVVIRDTAKELDPAYRLDRITIKSNYRSLVRVSLGNGGRRLGSVLLMSREPNRFTVEHGRTLGVVAEMVALAIAHEKLARDLAEESRRAAAVRQHNAQLEQKVQHLAKELQSLTPHRALGTSRRWREVLTQATKVAATETTVLLTGESGTGKEVVARFIHRGSPRKDGPFIALNCAALPEQLLESELFGHERGAFTGAQSMYPGRLEQAAGGILFLDEIGEMSPAVQAKFLRVLQEREFQRLGSTRMLKADVRVLAATNRDLQAAIARGTFREDLYYRLAVFDIPLPPLRERSDDIPVLLDAFMEDIARSVGRPAAGIAEDAREALVVYRWPGNVRELRNVIERAVILCEGGLIAKEHLPNAITSISKATIPVIISASGGDKTIPDTERDMIVQALARSGNNKSKAARMLGLTRAQLRSRIEKHGLEGLSPFSQQRAEKGDCPSSH